MTDGDERRRRRKRSSAFHWLYGFAAYPLLAALMGPALHLGGAPALSPVIWTSVALCALVLTGFEPRVLWRDPFSRAGLLLLVLGAFQLLPLPAGLAAALSPSAAGMHRASALAWSGVLPSWIPLSVDPGTGATLLHGMLGSFAVYLASHRLSMRGQSELVYRQICWAVLALVIVTWLHKLGETDRVYGFYLPRQAGGGILSPMLNPNHLAAFCGLGTMLWLGDAAARLLPAQRVSSQLAAVLCGALAVRTLSRGGIASLAVGMLTLVIALALKREERKQRAMQRVIATLFGVGAVVAMAGYLAAEQVLAEYRTNDLSKLRLILNSLRAVPQYWLFGAGLGGAFVPMASVTHGNEIATADFVECLPADLLLAFGVLPALAVGALGVQGLYALRPHVRTVAPKTLAAYLAVLTVLLHDMVDFSLFFAATGHLFAALLGTLSGTEARNDYEPGSSHRWPAFVLLGVSLAAGLVTTRSPLYLARLRARADVLNGPTAEAELGVLLRQHPGDPYVHLVAASWALRNGDEHRRAYRLVNRALALAPGWAEPHVLLLEALSQQGLRAQALVEARLAAEHSDFVLERVLDRLLPFVRSDEELLRAVPAGTRGLPLLRALQSRTGSNVQRLQLVLQAILERSPNDLSALSSQADLRLHANDLAGARALSERVSRAYPRAWQGAVGLARAHLAAGELALAEAVLRRALGEVQDRKPVLEVLAEAQTRRGDAAGMRATTRQLLEANGSDIDARVRVLGALGTNELALHNQFAALSAFEQANALAQPAHPYMSQVLQIARAVGDVPRLRNACNVLSDEGPLGAELSAVCNQEQRETRPPPGSAPTEGEGP